jgi:hypothetical protein
MSLERHPRVGGDPEILFVTGSKSPLISRLRGNDEKSSGVSYVFRYYIYFIVVCNRAFTIE